MLWGDPGMVKGWLLLVTRPNHGNQTLTSDVEELLTRVWVSASEQLNVTA